MPNVAVLDVSPPRDPIYLTRRDKRAARRHQENFTLRQKIIMFIYDFQAGTAGTAESARSKRNYTRCVSGVGIQISRSSR